MSESLENLEIEPDKIDKLKELQERAKVNTRLLMRSTRDLSLHAPQSEEYRKIQNEIQKRRRYSFKLVKGAMS